MPFNPQNFGCSDLPQLSKVQLYVSLLQKHTVHKINFITLNVSVGSTFFFIKSDGSLQSTTPLRTFSSAIMDSP